MKSIRYSLVILFFQAVTCWAQVTVVDGQGNRITLNKPAKRVISLAPHVTDLIYAAGVGNQLVGVTSESEPLFGETKNIPKVGSYSGISVEAILRQQPDLIVTWAAGGYTRELARLKSMGIAIFISQPLTMEDVGTEVLAIGTLLGNRQSAQKAADQYLQKLKQIQSLYRQKQRVKTFVQVSQAPMFTISKHSFLGQMVVSCGGDNVFGELPQAAPQINVEAVLRARPEVMISMSSKVALASWRSWSIPAVQNKQLYVLTSKYASLPSPSVLGALEILCRQIDSARKK